MTSQTLVIGLIFSVLFVLYIYSSIFVFKLGKNSRKILYLCIVLPFVVDSFYSIFVKSIHKGTITLTLLLVFFGISLFIFLWAIVTARTLPYAGEKPEKLIINGPWKYVRHPLYLSYGLNWVAMLLYDATICKVVFFFLLLIFYYKTARIEEKYFLLSAREVEYQKYMNITSMFIPFVF